MSTVDRVTHSESFEYYNPSTGLKGWRKTEMSASLIEGEDPIKETVVLRDKILEGFKAISGQTMTDDPRGYHMDGKTPYTHATFDGRPPVIDLAEQRVKEGVEKDIDDAQNLLELTSHKERAWEYGLHEMYHNKYEQFVNPK